MNERLYKYGFVVDENNVLDVESIRNHTINYVRNKGLWVAYLEQWNGDDPGNFAVIDSSDLQANIAVCRAEIMRLHGGKES